VDAQKVIDAADVVQELATTEAENLLLMTSEGVQKEMTVE